MWKAAAVLLQQSGQKLRWVSALFQDWTVAFSRRRDSRWGRRNRGTSGSRRYSRVLAFRISLLQKSFCDLLRPAGIIVGLSRFTVLVDGAFPLRQQIKNLPKVNVAPNLRPLLSRFRHSLQRLAKRVCRSLIVFLVKERFAHPEIR